MFIDRLTRNELNALSKELFGSASRWRKFIEGIPEVIGTEKFEEVPAQTKKVSSAEGMSEEVVTPATTKKVKVPTLFNPNPLNTKHPNGHPIKVLKRYTVMETLATLTDMKRQRDEMLVQIKKMEKEERAQKELQNKIKEDLRGSAL